MAKQAYTLSEIIAAVGDDKVLFQNIDTDASNFQLKGHTGVITFNTAPEHVTSRALGKASHIGLVVWIPRDDYDAVMQKRQSQ